MVGVAGDYRHQHDRRGPAFLPGGEVRCHSKSVRGVARLQRRSRGLECVFADDRVEADAEAFESLCRVPPLERKALALSETRLLSLRA